jgi:hypothetical protein
MAKRAKAAEVTTITPDPAAWRAALMLAGGDFRRLRATGSRTVLILNHQGQAFRRPPRAR